ncbi:alpha/beta-Hydrolases superfamily protein [Actinidia rufa]|nr:alpha/beta-Hydrolases superfamily protein [Actinidia rufa]
MDLAASTSSSLSSTSSSAASKTSWFSGIVPGRGDRSATVKMANNSAAAGDSIGPINRRKQFQGVMFKYGPKPIQV